MLSETDNIDQVEICLRGILKEYQYRKRKEIYQVDIDIIKKVLQGCDSLVNMVRVKQKNKIKRSKNDQTKYNYFMYFDKENDKIINV